jgi:hypothetical protein
VSCATAPCSDVGLIGHACTVAPLARSTVKEQGPALLPDPDGL